jgi:predicted short-subunit dehydrogenase-like oxidoreductase (DUF2520 family)
MNWREGGVGFIGAGATASVLARALHKRRYPVRAVASRRLASARALAGQLSECLGTTSAQRVADRCALVFITTPDDAIASVAAKVRWRQGQDVVHCSGALPVATLAPAQTQAANIGGFHPLQTFPHRNVRPEALEGITFGVQAEGASLVRLEQLAKELGGTPVRLQDADRALYHASAVLACGALAVVLGTAADLWECFSSPPIRPVVLAALTPLALVTVASVGQVGPVAALTGPIARGDVGTVRRHVDALKVRAPDTLAIYAILGLAQVPLALAKGCSDDAAVEIRRLLKDALQTGLPALIQR